MICAVNKIDRLGPAETTAVLAAAAELEVVDEVFPVSAKRGTGVGPLTDRLAELMPEGPLLYPPEERTDQPSEVHLAELIREQVLRRTREELPHAVEVAVEELVEREDGLVEVRAQVWAETDSQKSILIGKGGRMIREIGTAARKELERELGARVFLDLERARARALAPRRGAARPARDRLSLAAPPYDAPMSEAVRFDENGLVPCVLQDWSTGEVLTLAYMNDEALRLTLETREVHFFSRSRQELWRKGETSGNVQRLRQLRYDCDGDALVALVEPAGPACHTGERTCFYRDLEGSADGEKDGPPVPGEPEPAAHEALPALERTLEARRAERPEGSYTVELLADPAADRRQGPRGGRRGRPRGGRRVRRAGRRGGRRRPLPPRGADALARPAAGRGPGGAQ